MTTTPKGPHWIASVHDLGDVPTPDLNDARRELEAKVQAIEAQLGSSSSEGNVCLPAEHQWRRKAKVALRMTLNDITRIRGELTKREHPDYRKEREHRRAIDILADLIGALSYALPNDMLLTELIAEAKDLLATRELP